jgi:glycosyltransferase involved in cell wall biosynthesis
MFRETNVRPSAYNLNPMNEPGHEIEISVVVPIFREAESVEPLCRRLIPGSRAGREFLRGPVRRRWLDGRNPARHRAQNVRDPRIKAVSFSRNFGKEIAIAAGLDHARGAAVVIMDADLQHPPRRSPISSRNGARPRDGLRPAHGPRGRKPGEARLTHAFYRLFARYGETELPEGAGDFRLIDRKGVEVLRSLGERARFSKGLYAWIGFPSVGVPFVVEERQFGTTKWSFRKLFRFAFDGITSFSTMPLRVWTYLGGLISLLSIGTAIFFAIRTLLYGSDVPGYPSLIVSVMFFSGIQLMSLGMIGEYVGRIFAEVKRRPLYVVAETVGGSAELPAMREERRLAGV